MAMTTNARTELIDAEPLSPGSSTFSGGCSDEVLEKSGMIMAPVEAAVDDDG